MASFELFCSGAPETTDLMATEASELGAAQIGEEGAGITCTGTLEVAYRLCLWSRLAVKVQLTIASGAVGTTDELYALSRDIPWEEHLRPDDTFAVFATMRSSRLCPPNFAALRVKDAIVDRFRDRSGRRPSVDTNEPRMRIHVHVQRNTAQISIDLSGESLHRRGYRLSGAPAMLKETVAASFLIRAGWPEMAASGAPFIDPMCGSGTLPIEAALIAGDRAPGLEREFFGFEAWRGHDTALWERIWKEAKERSHAGADRIPPTAAYDINPKAIAAARENAERAGVAERIVFRTQPLAKLSPEPEMDRPGFVALDPPYGRRTGAEGGLEELYRDLGNIVKTRLPGWRGALLSADPELSRASGLWADKTNVLHNGAIKCVLAQFEVYDSDHTKASDPMEDEYREIFANRLKKNIRSLRKWREQEGVHCYRLYDADMPEFAVAVDVYEDRWVHVQEYAPPESVSKERARIRREVVLDVVPAVLDIHPDDVFYKSREPQKKGGQYGRIDSTGTFFEVREGGLRFLINLSDYLDSGLFLDHRLMRSRVRDEARDRRFLNLFSYTGSFSVYAACGGAASTTSVDLSNTYTAWAQSNFQLNELFDERHRFVRSEVRSWLDREEEQYDLIFLDPPTFSRSKRFKGTFQVQRDYAPLVSSALSRLSEKGVLYFSTNFRRFVLDPGAFPEYRVEDITQETIPFDFRRNPHIHSVYRFTRSE